MKKNIKFVFDEEWEDQEKELEQVLHEANDPILHQNIFILESVMRAAAHTFIKQRTVPRILGSEISKPKYFQKFLNIPSGIDIVPIPVPSSETQKQPLHEFKEVQKFENKVVTEEKLIQKKDLIIDKITNKPLATVEITDKYILTEPKLDENDIKVLNKLKKKKIKNMDKGWKLIQKYGKKYKIQPGHDTSIKYYLVNDNFGIGIVEPFLHDRDISSLYSEGEKIIVEINGKKLESNIKFPKQDIKNFIFSIAKYSHKKIDKKNPKLETKLRDFKFYLDLGENPSFKAEKLK